MKRSIIMPPSISRRSLGPTEAEQNALEGRIIEKMTMKSITSKPKQIHHKHPKQLDIPMVRDEVGIFRHIERPFGDTGSLIDVGSDVDMIQLMKEREEKKYPEQFAKIDPRNRKNIVTTKAQTVLLKKQNAYNKSAEIARYMRKHYCVEHRDEDRQSSLIEMAYRVLGQSWHASGFEEWLQTRGERVVANTAGLLSDITKPYSSIGHIEPDTATLIFHNLPREVKIDAAEWIKTQFEKAEEKRRRGTPLPIYHPKVMRPGNNMGPLKKNPGGLDSLAKSAKIGEMFERETKGARTFGKVVEQYIKRREFANAECTNAFGLVPREMREEVTEEEKSSLEKEHAALRQMEVQKMVQDKEYIKKMEAFEQMLIALLQILKTLINIKAVQLVAKVPIPIHLIKTYRSKSPGKKPVGIPMPDCVTKVLVERKAAEEKKAKAEEEALKPAEAKKSIVELEQKVMRSSSKHGEENVPSPTSNAQLTHDEPKQNQSAAGSVQEIDPNDFRVHSQNIIPKSASVVDFKDWLKQTLSRLEPSAKTPMESERTLLEAFTELELFHDLEKPVAPSSGLKAERAYPDVNIKIGEIMTMYPGSTIAKLPKILNTLIKIIESSGYLNIQPVGDSLPHGQKESAMAAVRRLEKARDRFQTLFTEKSCGIRPIWHDAEIAKSHKETHFSVLAQMASARSLKLQTQAPKKSSSKFGQPDQEYLPTSFLPELFHFENKPDADEQFRVDLMNRIPTGTKNFEIPTPIQRLNEQAGVVFTYKDMFVDVMDRKLEFDESEAKMKMLSEQKMEDLEWNTLERYKEKIGKNIYSRVYEKSMAAFRKKETKQGSLIGKKRPAKWFNELVKLFNEKSAEGSPNCVQIMKKLEDYCDITITTKKRMLNRLILTTISYPAQDILTGPVQKAFVFLITHMFQLPEEKLKYWLSVRGLPYILDIVPAEAAEIAAENDPYN